MSAKPVRIRRNVLRKMIEHARQEEPDECCGLLVGERGFIDRMRPCTNERKSPVAFSIPVAELFEFFRSLRENGGELMGIYHSHPRSEPIPSRQDATEFFYQGVSYWIVSLQNAKASVRCFGWERSTFVEQAFSILEDEEL